MFLISNNKQIFLFIFFQDNTPGSFARVHDYSNDAVLAQARSLVLTVFPNGATEPMRRNELIFAQLGIYLTPRLLKSWITDNGVQNNLTMDVFKALLEGNMS